MQKTMLLAIKKPSSLLVHPPQPTNQKNHTHAILETSPLNIIHLNNHK